MRRHDWADQMHCVIDQHADAKFEWGRNDCCLFVARVVDAMCDTDHESALSQNYHDEETALAYIKESGDIAQAVSTYIGEPKTGRPSRGDVVLFRGQNGETLGVCVDRSIVAMGAIGTVRVARDAIICYWSI